MSKQASIVAQLRKAIAQAERAGMTRYKLAQQTGLSQAMLSRFMAGENAPRLATAERIATAVGRRLVLAKGT
jgi:transcriptional regulator with XRE-family HTH domain